MDNDSDSDIIDDDPGTQHFNNGDTLRHKGFYEDSISELLNALTFQEPKLGRSKTKSAVRRVLVVVAIAATHYSLGLAYRATKDDYKQAMKHINTAKEIYEYISSQSQSFQKDKNTNTENTNTNTNTNTDNDKSSLSLSLSLFGQEIKDCKLNLARTHHSQGVAYQQRGGRDNYYYYEKSIFEHRKAIAIRESILGPSHLETARSHYALGCTLSDRDRGSGDDGDSTPSRTPTRTPIPLTRP